MTLGSECPIASVTCGNAKNEPLSGTDAPEIRYRRVRVWNGSYLEDPVLVKKVRSGKIYKQSRPNDLAIIGNAIQNGKQGVRIGEVTQRRLTFACWKECLLNKGAGWMTSASKFYLR